MRSKALTADQYMDELPEERKAAIKKLRSVVKKNLPKGFKEQMGYGMLAYVVPHNLYPAGYHCKPQDPLPFICIASQKNFIALHHLGLYSDKKLLDWFISNYAKAVVTKLDMGKGCVRFKKPELIPFELIGELSAKITPEDWIKIYEKDLKK